MRFNIVSADEIDKVLERDFGPAVFALGFTQVSNRKWVRSRVADIRDLIVIQALKGSDYSPIIGFSLDYVPHVAGQSMRWHRTEKSSRFDLRFDPLDYHEPLTDGFNQWIIDSIQGKRTAKRDARKVGRLTANHVKKTLDTVVTFEHLCDAFEAQIAREYVRFGFFNYIDQPLAYAFTLLRMGNIQKAKDMFDRWISLADADAKSVKAVEDLFNRGLEEFS